MSDFVDFNLSLNLDEVNSWDGTFQMIAPGVYTFRVANAEQVTTGTGNTGVKFSFEVLDEGDQKGKTIRKTYSLKSDPRVLARFKNVITALGVDPNNINGADLLDKQMGAEVFHKQMEGRTDATGAAVDGGLTMDLRGEHAVGGAAAAEPPPPPPPQAKKTALGGAKNGATATAARR
jgi:hypothetical protein